MLYERNLTNQYSYARNIYIMSCACILASLTLITPVYADGIDGLINSLIGKITPIFQALCKLSWFVAAVCIVVALFNVMISGSRGGQNSIAWLKSILIAVVCINIVGGVLTYIQGEITSGDLSNDLSNLGNYSGN